MALVLLVLALSACRPEAPPAAEATGARERAEAGALAAPPALPPDREERQRRSEAVRRAAEELAVRGVRTQDYLMNLIVEDDAYRVAFVRREGARLHTELRVSLRRDDFEVLSIDGLGDGGPGR